MGGLLEMDLVFKLCFQIKVRFLPLFEFFGGLFKTKDETKIEPTIEYFEPEPKPKPIWNRNQEPSNYGLVTVPKFIKPKPPIWNQN